MIQTGPVSVTYKYVFVGRFFTYADLSKNTSTVTAFTFATAASILKVAFSRAVTPKCLMPVRVKILSDRGGFLHNLTICDGTEAILSHKVMSHVQGLVMLTFLSYEIKTRGGNQITQSSL